MSARLFPVCLCVLFTLSSLPAVAEDGKEKEGRLKWADRDRLLLVRINEAIVKGCDYLKSTQRPDGSWQGVWFAAAAPHRYGWGETALCLLALLKSGIFKGNPVIDKGFRFLRKQPLKKTYEVAVLIMALEAKATPARHMRPPTSVPVEPRKLSPRDRDWMEECVRFLLANREMSWRLWKVDRAKAGKTPDTWHYPGPQGTTTDHSNTQLALLALKAARRCGIPVPPDVWRNTILHFAETQEKTGPKVQRVVVLDVDDDYGPRYRPLPVWDRARGWCYDAAQNGRARSKDKMTATTGSMTTVGISCLALALSELWGRALPQKLKHLGQRGILDGLAWLDHNWSVTENPKHPGKLWHYYYLYGVERAAVLTGRRNIGRRDWYGEGAEFLLKAQKSNGRWDDVNCPGPLNNTCFALLFLTRATVPIEVEVSGGKGKKKKKK